MEKHFKIEQYLKGEMSPTERAAFEKEIAANPDLREEVELNRDLQRFFDNHNPDLQKKLSTLGQKYFVPQQPKRKKKTAYLVAATLLLLLLVAWYCFFLQKTPAGFEEREMLTVEQPIQKPPITIPPDTLRQTSPPETFPHNPTPKSTQDQKAPTKPKSPSKSEPKPKPQPEKNNKPPKASQPIAQLDPAAFVENQLLEKLIKEKMRGTDLIITITNPPSAAVFPLQKLIPFTLQGTTNAQSPFLLKIYSNQPADFEADLPIFVTELGGTSTEEAQVNFQLTEKISLPAGLYYWMLLEKEPEKLIYLEKILVK